MMINNLTLDYHVTKFKGGGGGWGGGGGGGGGLGLSLWKTNFELGVGGEGQDTSQHFEGPYVQYCQCEASEQKLGQKPNSELKEIELSYRHHSICL